jgi:dihydrofolate synthase/folylpolyglutamate synthase
MFRVEKVNAIRDLFCMKVSDSCPKVLPHDALYPKVNRENVSIGKQNMSSLRSSSSPPPIAASRAIRSYAEAEAFLLSQVSYEVKPPPMRTDEEGWHLEAFRRLLERLGNPQQAVPVIHVAGTKGKGSTTRLLVSLLRAAGWRRVGSFTSPHIDEFRERIAVDNEAIPPQAFTEALEAVRSFLPETGQGEGFRTTFEILTAMAFWHFRHTGCDAVVLETGLGGRLDTTNVVTARVALVTTIGFDHQKVLGETLRAIAGEKAGIVKPGTGQALVGFQLPRRRRLVEAVVEEQARKVGVPVRFVGREPNPIIRATPQPWGFDLDLDYRGHPLPGIHFPVLGRHQLGNLQGVLAALDAFARLEGKDFDPETLRQGLENVQIPGRLERIGKNPDILVDGAHCPASAGAASKALAEHFPERPVVLMLGVLGDKNVREMLQAFARGPARVVQCVTWTPTSPRALDGGDLAQMARKFLAEAQACGSAEEAATRALETARKCGKDALVLATGSFYGIGPARRAFKSLSGHANSN